MTELARGRLEKDGDKKWWVPNNLMGSKGGLGFGVKKGEGKKMWGDVGTLEDQKVPSELREQRGNNGGRIERVN